VAAPATSVGRRGALERRRCHLHVRVTAARQHRHMSWDAAMHDHVCCTGRQPHMHTGNGIQRRCSPEVQVLAAARAAAVGSAGHSSGGSSNTQHTGGGVLEQVWMCASTSEPKAGSHAHCGACSCLRISPQTCPAALPPAYMWPQPRWACAWGCRRRLGLVWQRWLRQHTRAQEQEHAVSKQWANASTPEGQPCCAQASQAWRAQLRAERAP
jgi:hypothetical protein